MMINKKNMYSMLIEWLLNRISRTFDVCLDYQYIRISYALRFTHPCRISYSQGWQALCLGRMRMELVFLHLSYKF